MKETSFPSLRELSRERKEELAKELKLYDCQMRDKDRRLVCRVSQQNFRLLFHVVIAMSTLVLGVANLARAFRMGDVLFLTFSQVFSTLALFLMLAELIASILQAAKYIKELAANDGEDVEPPDNHKLACLFSLAVASMALGIMFFNLALFDLR